MHSPTPNTQHPTPRAALIYEPLGVVPATQHVQRMHAKGVSFRGRVECPTCGSLKAPGAVVTHGKPEWSSRYACMIVARSTYCDGCRHVIRWIEQAIGGGAEGTAGGATGVLLAGPGYYSGDAYIRRYLSAHPQAQEVEQV